MYLAVTNVKPLENYKLLLTFSNGEKKLFDVNPFLKLEIFKQLENVFLFNQVSVKFDTIEWPNTADFDPEFLYEKSELFA